MRKSWILVTVALATLLGLTGCGSSSSKAATSTAKKTASAAPVKLSGTVTEHGAKDVSAKGSSPSVEIEAYDFYFEPTYLKVAPGAKVTIELKNSGKMQHTFTIDGLGVDQTLNPGAKATVQATIPSSGAVSFFCRFHRGSGMQGAIYVTDGATVGATSAKQTSTTRFGY